LFCSSRKHWRRLTLLGFILLLVSISTSSAITNSLASIYLGLFGLAFVVTIWNSLKRKGHRTARLFRELAKVAGLTIAVIATYVGLVTFSRFLAFMAAGGNAGFSSVLNSSSSQGALGNVEGYLLIATIVLLVWIPQVFFGIQLDINGTGDAQRVLLGLITVASCATTGAVFLLFHFAHGPLRNVNVGTLVIGIIGTVLLVAHPYRSLAKVCWQRGIAGIFSPRTLKQSWGNVVTELGKALDRTAGHDVAPFSAASPVAVLPADPLEQHDLGRCGRDHLGRRPDGAQALQSSCTPASAAPAPLR
jgi:hypothetical protein